MNGLKHCALYFCEAWDYQRRSFICVAESRHIHTKYNKDLKVSVGRGDRRVEELYLKCSNSGKPSRNSPIGYTFHQSSRPGQGLRPCPVVSKW